jgi:acyl-CoA oxidase
MLNRYAQVLPDGTFITPANPALAYMTLISERLGALGMAFDSVAQAVTIATRYSAVRRQGPKNQQILDYQSQYAALTQIIAGAFVLSFAQK